MNISKTKCVQGLQCPKLLWTVCHAATTVPVTDATDQARFDEGTAVGELARSLFPDGVLVERAAGYAAMLRQTQALLAARRPIFEATFAAAGLYAQADILNPTADGRWDLIEVKMSTRVKPPHLQDLAIQRHCYAAAGVALRHCHLLHLNNQYVRQGALDVHALFAQETVTEQVLTASVGLADRLAELQRVVAEPNCPVIAMGAQCNNPYPCPLQGQCQAAQGGCAAAAPLVGEPTHDSAGLRKFLGKLVYPLYLLDFETYMRAIPPYDGTRPYLPIPFQFSLHIVEQLASAPTHHSWLWDGIGDPRAAMLTELRARLGDHGSVLAYWKCFEEARLTQSAQAFPEHAAWVKDLMPRMVDLIVPFRSRLARHPAQQGSNSLKAVLPAFTGHGYADLEIQDGNSASAEFVRVTLSDVPAAERAQVRHHLEAYCGRDTFAMLQLLRHLTALAVD